MVVEAAEGAVHARPAGPSESADVVLDGSPHAILALLSGQIDVAEARRRGLGVEGEERVLARLRPPTAAAGS